MSSFARKPVTHQAVFYSAYHLAWKEQEEQWKRLREWYRNVSPKTKMVKRTHLMDFAAGWNAAIRAACKIVGGLNK